MMLCPGVMVVLTGRERSSFPLTTRSQGLPGWMMPDLIVSRDDTILEGFVPSPRPPSHFWPGEDCKLRNPSPCNIAAFKHKAIYILN